VARVWESDQRLGVSAPHQGCRSSELGSRARRTRIGQHPRSSEKRIRAGRRDVDAAYTQHPLLPRMDRVEHNARRCEPGRSETLFVIARTSVRLHLAKNDHKQSRRRKPARRRWSREWCGLRIAVPAHDVQLQQRGAFAEGEPSRLRNRRYIRSVSATLFERLKIVAAQFIKSDVASGRVFSSALCADAEMKFGERGRETRFFLSLSASPYAQASNLSPAPVLCAAVRV